MSNATKLTLFLDTHANCSQTVTKAQYVITMTRLNKSSQNTQRNRNYCWSLPWYLSKVEWKW